MREGRSQCIVVRDNKILMAKHRINNISWYCLPGGGIEENETPEQAAIRELYEECCVSGIILKKTSEYMDPFSGGYNYTFQIDIGSQEPVLGKDPELTENPILIGIEWLSLSSICERDRAYLWAAGLITIKEFADELNSWNDDISYPSKREIVPSVDLFLKIEGEMIK